MYEQNEFTDALFQFLRQLNYDNKVINRKQKYCEPE